MNTMIPNPSRKVVVNSNIEHVKTALNKMKDFCSDGSNTIVIATGSYNGTLNTYNFMSRGQITGIIDMGMNGTATVVKVDENNTEITVLEVRGDQVKIGISAPKEVPVYRKEVYLQIQEENKESMSADSLEALKNLF